MSAGRRQDVGFALGFTVESDTESYAQAIMDLVKD